MTGRPAADEWRDAEFCEPHQDEPPLRRLLDASPGRIQLERVICHHDGTFTYYSVTDIEKRSRVKSVWESDRPFIREHSRMRFEEKK